MNPSQVTVLGECVADAFTVSRGEDADGLTLRVLPGGGPANTAVALARLGTPTRFVGRLSGDVFGRLFRARLTAAGADLGDSVTAREPSTLAVADATDPARVRYSFHADGAADWQWTAAELEAVPLGETACVHTGSLALARDPGGRRIEEFLARVRPAATVSIDPNVRPLLVPAGVYRDRLDRWCELADILRLSEDDLEVLLPGLPPERACDRWHAAGVPLVVVTLGARGALASLDGRRVAVTAPPAEVVDTVGAGDSFTAGLLHHLGSLGLFGGRLHGLTAGALAEACRTAARVAALTCSVAGANPPWAREPTVPEPADRRG
ncbi:carbohydrate kinase [Streptomyces sp. F63]|uniref:carbohydrate kinase family protein n=1 Tax=Streptomyces sp. F63 TaxID=2824887 RepID=UPI001B37AF68|nr:carbohydrate kinase [Streptomyces sp. F63]MBQ0987031.1 carbohydrate kinase [Streptomyces sp. F63]